MLGKENRNDMMSKLYQSMIGLFTGLLMFSGCNNQEEVGSLQIEDNNVLPPYSVTLRLGGSASIGTDAAYSRVGEGQDAETGELQTENEKRVNTLYAVVFEDKEVTKTDNLTGNESNDDTFYKAFSIEVKDLQANPVLSFSLAKEGNFQVCFVANPSDELVNGITNNVTTVSDFKGLMESMSDQPQAPEQYLMTSSFYTLATSYETPQDLGEVALIRAMARFDISNAADGYVITSVVFHNRAFKTSLISDDPTYESTNVTNTTYKMNLVGNSDDPAVYSATIYSFEQYAGGNEDFGSDIEGLPYLEIKYQVPSLSSTTVYSHNVYFKKAKENEVDSYYVLPIKRNNLYKINMVKDPNANLSFTITILDWNSNTEIDVSRDDLVAGVSNKPLEKVAVGDYYMSDGTLRDGSKELSAVDKAKVIGVVFQTDVNRIGEKEKAVLTEKGVKTPHGLAMAVKLAGSNCTWGDQSTTVGGSTNDTSLKAAYEDINGLSNYTNILSQESASEHYPAFQAVADFSVSAPEKSTGWFLPSIGQWWDIVANLGGMSTYMQLQQSDDTNSMYDWSYSAGGTSDTQRPIGVDNGFAQKNINSHLEKLGKYADPFSVESHTAYWSSSVNGGNVRYVNFTNSGFGLFNGGEQSGYNSRAVLAF